MRAVVPVGAQPAQGARVATSRATADGADAARAALAILKFREAPRIGVLGDSGTGKTHAMRWIVALYLELEPRGVVMVIDDKGPVPRFRGQYRRDANDLRRRPADPKGPRVVVFRGDFYSVAGDVDQEAVAELQWEAAQNKRPTMVVYDELDKAADGGQWKAGKDSRIAWALGKGRDVGAASLWGTQETEAVPRQAFNQSTSLFTFRMRGNPVRLLKQREYLNGGADAVLPTLAGEPLPPAQRGTFLHLSRAHDWDNEIYKFRS